MAALPVNDEQRAALNGLQNAEFVPVFDQRRNRAYFLVPADVYERLRSGFSDLDNETNSHYPLMDEVARREGWDDPEMDAYDLLDPRNTA